MKELLIIAGMLVWTVSGVWGSFYWWRRDYDVELRDYVMLTIIGIIGGPIVFFYMWATAINRKRLVKIRWGRIILKKKP